MRGVVQHEYAFDQGGANNAGYDHPEADDDTQEEDDTQEGDAQVRAEDGCRDHAECASTDDDRGSRSAGADDNSVELAAALELAATVELTATELAASADPHHLAQEQGLPAVLRLLALGLV